MPQDTHHVNQIKNTTGYHHLSQSNKLPHGPQHVNHTPALYVINSMSYLSQEVIFTDVRLWQTCHDVNKTLNHFLLGIDHSNVKSTDERQIQSKGLQDKHVTNVQKVC